MKAGVKTPVEFHAVDTLLYVEQGHAHNMVEGTTMDSGPGDVVFHDAGAWHQNEATSDDYTQIEFKLPHAASDSNQPAADQKALDIDKFPRRVGALIHNADVPALAVCEVKTGKEKKMVPRTPQTASSIPKDALCLTVKMVMARPSGRLIELTLPKGMKTEAHQNTPEDTLFRVVTGRVHFDGAGQSADLKPGDMAYVPTGALHTFIAQDDAKLLETHYIPLAAR
jgi:mannose-6-phosphate isomerase-like protein (cupin superfamily)